MFTQVSQPLAYAQALLTKFTLLSQATDDVALLSVLVREVSALTGCELTQLYVPDATQTTLHLNAEWLDGAVRLHQEGSLPGGGEREQALEFALRQGRPVLLADLNESCHDAECLPQRPAPWRALLRIPLLNQHNVVTGLLLCASHQQADLQGFASSLGCLGSFALTQLQLLRRVPHAVNQPADATVQGITQGSYGLIGSSTALRRTCSLIGKVLDSSCTVLLQGETGTGKELVARAIHEHGPRRSKAFIVQNCAAFPESLLESELFGYRKGAFTGAEGNRAGLFDAADGGTLLLDEIGDMPFSLQAKLLRVLQENEIRPLGSSTTHSVNVRIIAATHRDLRSLISQGKFREDLYYRLAQFPIELPALRQRGADVLELARHFLGKACARRQRAPVTWSEAASSFLCSHDFPGNVRELKYLIERAVLLCEGRELQLEHFPQHLGFLTENRRPTLRERLERVERNLILECLQRNQGNQTLAALELGLPRRTLLYRLGRLNIGVENIDA